MEFQRVAPEGLVSEGIEAKYFLSFLHRPLRVIPIHTFESYGRCAPFFRLCGCTSRSNQAVKTDSQPCEKNQTDRDLQDAFHGIHLRLNFPARGPLKGRTGGNDVEGISSKDFVVSCGGKSVQKCTRLKYALVQSQLP